jgi:hypothetical protein
LRLKRYYENRTLPAPNQCVDLLLEAIGKSDPLEIGHPPLLAGVLHQKPRFSELNNSTIN